MKPAIPIYETIVQQVEALQFDGSVASCLAIIAAFQLKGWHYVPHSRASGGAMLGKKIGELAVAAGDWFVKAPGRRVQVLENCYFRREYQKPDDPYCAAVRLIHRAITLAKQGDYLTAGPVGPALLAHEVERLLVNAITEGKS